MITFSRRQPPWESVSGGAKAHPADKGLSTLLAVQVLVTFVAIPLGAVYPTGHTLLDMGNLVFAAVCSLALTSHHVVRAALLGSLLMLAMGPLVWSRVCAHLGIGADVPHEAISMVAFAFNLLVTALVAGRAFGPGKVTSHRIQGAILLYLNVASLFSIAYGILEAHFPGAIHPTTGGVLARGPGTLGTRTAAFSYFSLATITTTGYGDLAPVHPLARSLANLEAVFGQIFPAIFLARLVSLHLVHSTQSQEEHSGEGKPNA